MTPGAREDRFGPVIVDSAGTAWLSIRVRAPAEQGRANEAVRRLVAAALQLPLSRVTLRAGATDRRKRLMLAEVDADHLDALLQAGSSPTGDR